MKNTDDRDLSEMAARILTLQRGYTSPRNEREIARQIFSVDGLDLTKLKNMIDRGGDHCDLLELVYSDIDNRDLREEIIQHFKTRSATFLKPPIRILSDVDDTLYSSLHDKRYPTSSLYPGVVTFHEELQRASVSENSPVAALILLTARPRDKLGLVERWTQRQMVRKGLPEMTVLSGTLFDLRSHEAMANRKLLNFQMYEELYPEYRFLFFGDSGQGDALLGQMMMQRFPSRIMGAFIHQVNDRLATDGLIYFDSYLRAAVALRDQKILDSQACLRIHKSSADHLEKMVFESETQKRKALDSLKQAYAHLVVPNI